MEGRPLNEHLRPPVLDVLPDVERALAQGNRLLLIAPPGAGKTTEIPRALLNQPWCQGSIIATQPRRIAARLAATYVASLRQERVGESVGYRVRFDEKASSATRLVFETEGLLLRRLLLGDALRGVSAVIIDEVHERSHTVDCLLALLLEKQKTLPNLRLLLMSATLDAPELARALGDAPVLESHGRSYPVELRYQEKPDERPLPLRVRGALASVGNQAGDVLIFLPGAREIREVRDALGSAGGSDVLALHGDLPIGEQAKVTAKGGDRRRIILSTNVAESSVTIPGVTTVIDTGLARVARHDFLSGATRLRTEEVSQARLIQRAGRAGRTAPGLCLRLFSKGSFERRAAQDTPELLRTDLSEILLLLLAAGVEARALPWPSQPDPRNWERAENHLTELGAMQGGKLVDIGRKMATLPLPPRLARVVVDGYLRGCLTDSCRAAALLAEKDLKRRVPFFERSTRTIVSSDSDLDDRLALLELAEEARFSPGALRAEGIDSTAAQSVQQSFRQVMHIARSWPTRAEASNQDTSKALTACLLSGFFDRVAERRGSASHLLLASGAQALLSEDSAVAHAKYLLAVGAGGTDQKLGHPIVQVALRLDPNELLDLQPDRVGYVETANYDRDKDRVELRSLITYGKLILSETVCKAPPGPLRSQALLSEALARGESAYDPLGHLETLAVKLTLLATHRPELVADLEVEEHALVQLASDHGTFCRAALASSLDYVESIKELRELDLAEVALTSCGPNLARVLGRELPDRIALAGGRELPIKYQRGQPPFGASRLQDFFSMSKSPTLLSGRLPLQLHLLAPNRRAIQVTTDLSGFWQRHYPELRRALMRRYPKHSWPEDGLTAAPPPPGRPR